MESQPQILNSGIILKTFTHDKGIVLYFQKNYMLFNYSIMEKKLISCLKLWSVATGPIYYFSLIHYNMTSVKYVVLNNNNNNYMVIAPCPLQLPVLNP